MEHRRPDRRGAAAEKFNLGNCPALAFGSGRGRGAIVARPGRVLAVFRAQSRQASDMAVTISCGRAIILAPGAVSRRGRDVGDEQRVVS